MNNFVSDEASLVRKLTIPELESYLLEKGFLQTAVTKIKEQEVDGWSFLKLEERHFSEMSVSIGQRIKLLDFIAHLISESHGGFADFPAFMFPETSHSDATSEGSVNGVANGDSNLQEITPDLSPELDKSQESLSSLTDHVGYPSIAETSVANIQARSKEILIPNNFFNFMNQDVENTNLDVINILRSEPAGSRIVELYFGKSIPISVEDRQIIVRLTVQHLTKSIGHLYPSSEMKENLAKKIVEAFPSLALNRPGLNPYSYLYNKGTTSGFIDTRLKTMRKTLPMNERKRRTSDIPHPRVRKLKHRTTDFTRNESIAIPYDEAEIEQKVTWLSENLPSAETDATIIAYMQDTFQYRKDQIDKNLATSTMILEKYPRFIDFDNGSLVFADFLHRYPNAGNFRNSFMKKYAKKVFRLASFYGEQIEECSDDCLQALFLSLKIFPSVRKIKKIPMASLLEYFIVFRPEDTDLESFPRTKPPHLEQPFLLCLGSYAVPKEYYLVVDDYVIACGDSSENAFKVLFSSFFTFGIEYPIFINQWYQFFEEAVFNIRETSCNNVASFTATLESLPR